MYRLEIHYPGEGRHRDCVVLHRGAEVVAAVPGILARHAGCERIVVYAEQTRLFSVDRQGNREPG